MTEAIRVLIVEDDPDVLLGCEQALQLEGISTIGCDSAEKALRAIRNEMPGLVVSDVRLPGKDGMALMREALEIDQELPVVLITGHGDVALAVQAMKAGAYDFVEKPFSPEYLVDVVRRGLEKRRLILEVRQLRHRLQDQNRLEARIIGGSSGIEQVRQMVAGLADTNAPLLINGETGTGKELIARCLHDSSSRRNAHFVAINCGGLPENLVESELFGHESGAFTGAAKRRVGKIEYANGGTLFLDEIESMPISIQIKLLRVLQEKTLERLGSNTAIPVDCRIVAATKEDLNVMVDEGRFRADLYYRLNVASVMLPSLRERREDIPLLFEHFVQQASLNHERTAAPLNAVQLQKLIAYTWPGNVRELRNVADRWVLGIGANFPPFSDQPGLEGVSLQKAVESFERALIADAFKRNGQNLSQTAQVLQVPKTTLHDKMKKLGLIANT